jgi:hypothetical protein
MPAIFPRTATAAPASRSTPPVASRETHETARRAVRDLLERTQAFDKLDPKKREALAQGLVQISTYLAEPDGQRLKQQSPQVTALADVPPPAAPPPQFGQGLKTGVEQAGALMQAVNFPQFVTGLINGVFHSIVTSSIEQMEAYAKLVADVSKSLNQFRDDNTTQNQGRDHLVEQFPDIFQLSMDSGDFDMGGFGDDNAQPAGPRVVVRDDVDEQKALGRINSSLPLDKPVTSLDDDVVEAALVPAARTQLATGRQQLLATMVMLGINRIVVTDGRISAKVMYDFQSRDNTRYRNSATQFDHEKDAYGNLQMTRDSSGDYEYKREGGSQSSDQTTDPNYYAKGSYKYAEQPVVKLMSASQLQSDSSLQAKASLAGQVEVNFKSDYLPLDKLANPDSIAAIQMNAQPGMVKTLATNRPPAAPAAAPAATTPAATTPAPATTPAR